MSSTDDSEVISDNSADISFGSESDSSFSANNYSHGYVGEPEYNETEMKSHFFWGKENDSSDMESENDELNSSRTENLHWCKCAHCTIMPSFVECKCCKEYDNFFCLRIYTVCKISAFTKNSCLHF